MSRSKQKGKERAAAAVTATTEASPPGPIRRLGIGGVAAGVAIAICLALTWLSQWALNVDGVSYLDLARTVSAGDWGHFVQGYWSPLYPATIGVLASLTDGGPATLMALSHLLNGAVTIAAIVLLFWWGRKGGRPYLAPALIATFLLASRGLPRIEAVTPDVLLLVAACWIGYELLHHRDERALPMGVALGLSFLAKTSVWPWLLVSIPLRLWSADGPRGRRGVLISSGIAVTLASLWVVPLSLKTGSPTLGSAGKLNYAWYIESSNARTPDTHLGRHQAAYSLMVDAARHVEVFTFDGTAPWTYAPWSDPTKWGEGVTTSNGSPPLLTELIAYWGRQGGRTFGPWMLPIWLGILAPFGLAFWDRGLPGRLFRERRTRTTTFLLGLAGILQFVAIHSEPRLIAPFVFLLAAAVLDGVFAGAERLPTEATRGRLATLVAWSFVLWLSSDRISAGLAGGPRNAATVERIVADQRRAAAAAPHAREIIVAGPALPVTAAAFIAGVRIVAQLPPSSLAVAQTLPPDQQDALLREIAADRAGIVWITDPTGGVRIVPVPAGLPNR